ncbi:MAG: PD40 domain-containing protein [Planctomycetes bacterium]|nr:PD40 domain-containing protein [Planctomycetota bacterium]
MLRALALLALAVPASAEPAQRLLEKVPDGIEFSAFECFFSSDGAHYAYRGKQGGKAQLFFDGKSTGQETGGLSVQFSDGGRFAFAAALGEKMFTVVDGKKGERFDAVGAGDLVFSPDGKRFAYQGIRGEKCAVIVDGKKDRDFESVQCFVFSVDGRHIAYVALAGGKYCIVLDGKKGEDFDVVGVPVFTADGKAVMFGAVKGKEIWWKVVTVGK